MFWAAEDAASLPTANPNHTEALTPTSPRPTLPQVEAAVLGETGDEVMGDVKQCQKRIKVPNLCSKKTDIPALAEAIVDKCRYIHPSKLAELEQLLLYLQTREAGKPKERRGGKRAGGAGDERSLLDATALQEKASFDALDEYLEMLYDDTKAKIRGTGLILQLARNPDNMEELAMNETLMGALSRVLREEGLSSTELVTNIVSIFFFYSSFTPFHTVISRYKIGATCMKVVEQEMKRFALWTESMDRKRRRVKAKKMTKEEYAKEEGVFREKQFRQEVLLYVAFHLLLNLAEDQRVEIKMRNKNIVEQLVTMLQRQNVEFLILVVTFLKKLSVYAENKNEMASHDVVRRLQGLVPHPNPALQSVTLRLLLNLSFDPALRYTMVELGLVPRLVDMLPDGASDPDDPGTLTLLSLLYQLSMDAQSKGIFSFTECVPRVMRMILASPRDPVDVELAGLGVNLALHPRNAALMCDNNGLKLLLKRAIKSGDSLLLKMARNVSQHPDLKPHFLAYIDPLARMLQQCQEEDMLVEIVGILGNIDVEGFDYQRLIDEYDLLGFANDTLLPGGAEDDLVLEVVILVGTILSDERCAQPVARSGIVQSMVDLLKAKQEDDEIVLQIVYVWNKLLFHEATREIVLAQSTAVLYLLDLMHDKNDAIRRVVSGALGIIMEVSEGWAAEIRMKKFQFHNERWLDMVADPEGPADE